MLIKMKKSLNDLATAHFTKNMLSVRNKQIFIFSIKLVFLHYQGRIQGVFEAGIPVWTPKFGAQKNFSGQFNFNGVLCVFFQSNTV